MPVIPGSWKLMQEDHEFKVSLSYITILSLKINKKKKKEKRKGEREKEGGKEARREGGRQSQIL